MKMLQHDPDPSSHFFTRLRRSDPTNQGSNRPIRAKVKPECMHLYPGVDPKEWYAVVQEGEYKDDMEGLWIQVTDWVTYVLAKHFDLEARPETH
jgi:hypothetical protein